MPPLRIRYVHLLHKRPDLAALRRAEKDLLRISREIGHEFGRRIFMHLGGVSEETCAVFGGYSDTNQGPHLGYNARTWDIIAKETGSRAFGEEEEQKQSYQDGRAAKL